MWSVHRALTRKHYIGLLCCFVGICLVGGSSLMTGSGGAEKNANQIIVGMLLIVLAQVSHCQAVPGCQLLAFSELLLYFLDSRLTH